MARDCFNEIKKLLGEQFDEDVANRILDDLEVLKANESSVGFRRKAAQYFRDNQVMNATQRKQRLSNLTKVGERRAFYERFNDPVEALQGLLAGSQRNVAGANFSVERVQRALDSKWKSALQGGLEDAGVWDSVRRGQLEKQIAQELFEFRPGGQPGVSGSIDARKAAEVIHNTQKLILKELRDSGADIGDVPGYIMRQSHDAATLREIGFDAWATKIVPRLDLERTFGIHSKDAKFIDKRLRQAYDDIVFGRDQQADGAQISDELITVNKRPASLARKFEKSRKLHFKSGEDFFEYNREFGKHTLIDSIMSSINQNSKNSALMQFFGTNPEASFQADITRLLRAANARGDKPTVEKLQSNRKKIESLFAEVKGLTNIPGRSILAKTARGVRAFQNMSKLGGVALASITDLGSSAAILRSATGKGFLESHLDLAKSFLATIAPKQRKLWARKTGLFIDDMLGDLHSRFDHDAGEPGLISKAERLFFKVNGLADQTAIGRTAVARQFAIELAEQSSKGFNQLAPRVRANLQRYNITSSDWALIKNAVEDIEGVRAITPESVLQLDMPADKKRDLEFKIMSYLSDHADLGVPQPGARTRNFLLRGTSPDEGMGQFLRFVAQFKSFPVTMHSVLSRVAMSDPQRNINNLREIFLARGDMQNLAGLVISTTALGYLGKAMLDTARGRTPEDPLRPDTWANAFLRGGSAGLYGDFILGEYDRAGRSVLATAAGPTLSQVDEVGKIWAKARKGQDASRDFTRLLIGNTPGQNLFWLRPSLDYLILNEIQESLSPGYLRRRENRLRQQNQEFFVPQVNQ